MKSDEVKKIVKNSYSKIATNTGCGCSCGCTTAETRTDEQISDISRSIGYSEEEMNAVPGANLGLGCGNPTALGEIRPGDVVLDLGSGAGFDSFLAARKVGENGKVIGVDMTEEMVWKARHNAKKHGYENVEFRLGDIENLPVEDGSVDVIISNCVINLAPDKLKVFREGKRVLKDGGKMYISDIVLLEELSEEQRKDGNLIAGCVGGALLKDDYLAKIEEAGLEVRILEVDGDISERQYNGIALESLKMEAWKK